MLSENAEPNPAENEVEARIQKYLSDNFQGHYELIPWPTRSHDFLLLVVFFVGEAIHAVANFLQKIAERSGARMSLKRELAAHLEDAYASGVEAGLKPDAAWENAAKAFGDPEEVALSLRATHRVALLEWLGRGAALGIFCALIFWVLKFSLGNFLGYQCAILLFFPAIAIFLDPKREDSVSNAKRSEGEESGGGVKRLFSTRGAFIVICALGVALGLVLSRMPAEIVWSFLIVVVGASLTLVFSRDLSWASLGNACAMWSMTAVIYAVFSSFLANIADIEAVGRLIATLYVTLLYCVLLVELPLLVALVLLGICYLTLPAVFFANGAIQFFIFLPGGLSLDVDYLLIGFWAAAAMVALGWALYGSSGLERRLPSLAIFGVICVHIMMMGNLDSYSRVNGYSTASFIPALLCLYPLVRFARLRLVPQAQSA